MDVLIRVRLALRTAAVLGVCIAGMVLAEGSWSQASVPASAPGDESLEYRVKAAYLLNFARYVEWPASTSADSSLGICVIGHDPFGQVLDATVSGRTAHGKPLHVRRIQTASEATGCQVVFVGRDIWRHSPERVKALNRAGSLTVGETEQFARRGGVIGFVIVDETVRFVVNDEARSEARLRISSRMLSLAAAIYDRSRS
jgi:hypothetical protein